MKKEILHKLVTLADSLDKLGMHKAADQIDLLLKQAEKKMTVEEARNKLKEVGLRIKKTDGGDYRVWNPSIPKDRQEATAYYDTELEDCVNTGLHMAKKGKW